eukprot:704356-Rhodomonas_salina.2
MRLRSAASHEGAESQAQTDSEETQLQSSTALPKSQSISKVRVKLLCCCARSALFVKFWSDAFVIQVY